MLYLFKTSETDDQSISRDSAGNYYCKRYGLSKYPISRQQAESIAWFEANRRGMFTHLIEHVEGDPIPHLTNKPAQDFIVKALLRD